VVGPDRSETQELQKALNVYAGRNIPTRGDDIWVITFEGGVNPYEFVSEEELTGSAEL